MVPSAKASHRQKLVFVGFLAVFTKKDVILEVPKNSGELIPVAAT
jgi:hypothetical protein